MNLAGHERPSLRVFLGGGPHVGLVRAGAWCGDLLCYHRSATNHNTEDEDDNAETVTLTWLPRVQACDVLGSR